MRPTLVQVTAVGVTMVTVGSVVVVSGTITVLWAMFHPDDMFLPMAVGLALMLSGGLLFGPGMPTLLDRKEVADRWFARYAGLTPYQQRRVEDYQASTIIPEENRRANPEVAKAAFLALAVTTTSEVRAFSRIANSLLTPTDVADVMGDQLSEFIFEFSQLVEHAEDRDVEGLLAPVRSGAVSAAECVEYLRVAGSIPDAVEGIRLGIAPSYLGAVA